MKKLLKRIICIPHNFFSKQCSKIIIEDYTQRSRGEFNLSKNRWFRICSNCEFFLRNIIHKINRKIKIKVICNKANTCDFNRKNKCGGAIPHKNDKKHYKPCSVNTDAKCKPVNKND